MKIGEKISKSLKNSERFKKAMELQRGENNPAKRLEVREKISKAKRGENHHFYHRNLSEEHKKKISKALKGKKKNISFQGRKKISDAQKGIPKSEEHKKKLSDAKKGEKHPFFNNWSSRKPYCEKWSPELREEVRNRFENRCFQCNKHQLENYTKSGKIRKLSIHHVNYDKEQGCNNKDWILIPLCSSCHSKTNNINQDYWQNFFIDKLHEQFSLKRHFEGDI